MRQKQGVGVYLCVCRGWGWEHDRNAHSWPQIYQKSTLSLASVSTLGRVTELQDEGHPRPLRGLLAARSLFALAPPCVYSLQQTCAEAM